MQIIVRDNNVDQALKALKKKMQREGLFREMKLRNHYEKPSEKRAREKAEAVRRARKLQRKKLQREGVLPRTPKVDEAARHGRPALSFIQELEGLRPPGSLGGLIVFKRVCGGRRGRAGSLRTSTTNPGAAGLRGRRARRGGSSTRASAR